jgi:excisionase family DNA binding protein
MGAVEYNKPTIALQLFPWAVEALTPNAVLTIEVQTPPIIHSVPLKSVEEWLQAPSLGPREESVGQQVTAATPPPPTVTTVTAQSPWLRVADAAMRAQCARSTIYSEVQEGRLRAARVGSGRILRIRAEWIDDWLEGGAGEN